MESHFRISIIGLGIIGGSAAYALKGFNNAEVIGFDKSDDVMGMALERGAIDKAAKSVAEQFGIPAYYGDHKQMLEELK